MALWADPADDLDVPDIHAWPIRMRLGATTQRVDPPGYSVGKYEVTAAQYRLFCRRTRHAMDATA